MFDALRSPLAWYALLVGVCIAAPYALGFRPRTRRDWILLTATIGFLTWLLAGLASVRA